jgi:hypothetical protein
VRGSRIAQESLRSKKSPFLGFAEIMGPDGHFVEHRPDLLPFRIELFESGRGDGAGIDSVI